MTGISITGFTACGHWKGHAQRLMTPVQCRSHPAPYKGCRSNQKWQEQLGAEESRPWKKSWVEVEESDAQSEGSGAGGWKARGLQEISFSLIRMRENQDSTVRE